MTSSTFTLRSCDTRFTKRNDITINGIRLGLTLKDSVLIRREADHTPRLQTFILEDLEEDPPKERTYRCAICKLVYLTNTETIWRCDNCLSYYDTKIQDRPVKDKSEFKLKSYHDPYKQFDEDDLNMLFVEGIDIESLEQEDGVEEIIRSSTADKRIQHIKAKGNLADALAICAITDVDGGE